MTQINKKLLKDAYLNRHNLSLVLVHENEEFTLLNKGKNIDFHANVENRREEDGDVYNPVFVAVNATPPYLMGNLIGRFSSRNAARRRYNIETVN
jgi:hypothetical protein